MRYKIADNSKQQYRSWWVSAYGIGGVLLQPFVRGLLRWRAWRAREELQRLPERRGIASLPRPDGYLLWVHAVSVGEVLSVLRLTQRIHQGHQPTILFTTTTVSGARIIDRYITASGLDGIIHQYLPVDCPGWIRKFLDHWQPDSVVWVESDFWPQIMAEVHFREIPAVLINARLSERSARMSKLIRPVLKPAIEGFRLCLTTDTEQIAHFEALGAANVHCLGNLKAAPNPVLEQLSKDPDPVTQSAPGPNWIAISTHQGEEEPIIAAHKRLIDTFPQLLTIIAPRDINRAQQIEDMATAANLTVQRKSHGSGSSEVHLGGAIYIVDTMGELGEVLPTCSAALVGGSLIPRGGHNPYEPIYFNNVLLHGPNTTNFHDVYSRIRNNSASWLVHDGEELVSALQAILSTPKLRSVYTERAHNTICGCDVVTEEVFQAIDRVIFGSLRNKVPGHDSNPAKSVCGSL
ncbi:3-deoxy-D-manno-octulosonic acid transferase [Halorhodospira halochloris]|uniref:3-deoxy-D-manno-octulosonic acid transferase n=1 Tax=Halorhodospira halochloris TaxID=1052 RepID=UPI001EE8D363|nr:hypothetical protein [Halorhodospira halochloris]